MSSTTRVWMTAAAVAAALAGSQLIPANALADPEVPPATEAAPAA